MLGFGCLQSGHVVVVRHFIWSSQSKGDIRERHYATQIPIKARVAILRPCESAIAFIEVKKEGSRASPRRRLATGCVSSPHPHHMASPELSDLPSPPGQPPLAKLEYESSSDILNRNGYDGKIPIYVSKFLITFRNAKHGKYASNHINLKIRLTSNLCLPI